MNPSSFSVVMQDPTKDPVNMLPFAERWNHVGNAATEQQIVAARKALQTPESRAASRESKLVLKSGKEYFSRTGTSLKLRDELRIQEAPQRKRTKRASVIELGSPLRHMSKSSSLSQEVKTELPKWRPAAAGSQVQILDRPDWLRRVEKGLALSRSTRGSFRSSQAKQSVTDDQVSTQRSRKGTEGSILADEDDEEEQNRQRRLQKIEQVRLRDAEKGEFDEVHLPHLSATLPNMSFKSDTLKSLDAFNKKVKDQARRSSYLSNAWDSANPMRRISRARVLNTDEEAKVDHFWAWCKEQFGSLDKAFQAFDLNGNGQLSSVEFADGCRSRGYPGNPKTYKRIFFLMDADLDGAIGKPEFMGSKIRRMSTLEALEAARGSTETRASVTHDAFDMMDSKPKRSTIHAKRATMVNDLFKQDPPVSQFISFLFMSYATLKDAFRQIDINRNGLLSKSEFKDGLRILRVGKLNLLDKHLDDLYDRLDINGDGNISVNEMISETCDPMIHRLTKYLLEVRSDFHAKNEKEAKLTREQRLARVFAKLDDNMNMELDRKEFTTALKRMRYIDWHVGDLFDRLDRDRSGQLSVEEFSAFLEKDRVKASTTKKADGDGTTEIQMDDPTAAATRSFQEKFETGAYALIFNSKLQKIGTRSGHTSELIRAGQTDQQVMRSTAPNPGTVGRWTTDDSGGFAQRFERGTDYCEEVRKRLRRPDNSPRRSTLRMDGRHTYGVSPMYSVDYLPLCNGLDHMTQRVDFARTMVTF